MENSVRLYQCARCHCQVVICSYCDRGNIYCANGCARLARGDSLKAAGKRYQQSRRGRFSHAERQRRYRSRRNKVTHQGSPASAPNVPLVTRSTAPAPAVVIEVKDIRCHFCKRLCSRSLRLSFLRRASGAGATNRQVHHWPPRDPAQAP